MKWRRKIKFNPKQICVTDDDCQAAVQGRSGSLRRGAIAQPKLPSAVVALSPGKPLHHLKTKQKKSGWIITCSVNNLGIRLKA